MTSATHYPEVATLKPRATQRGFSDGRVKSATLARRGWWLLVQGREGAYLCRLRRLAGWLLETARRGAKRSGAGGRLTVLIVFG